MEKGINAKIKKKLDNIIEIKLKLKNWKELSENEVSSLLKDFEKIPRDEVSTFFIPELKDNLFANILIEIANNFNDNSKINENVISSLGNLIERYQIEETDYIYKYFFEKRNNKNIGAYVSLFITKFDKFKKDGERWEYMMSILHLKPKNVAENSFEMLLSREKENIPKEYKKIPFDFYTKKAMSSNNEDGRKYYHDLAKDFEK